MQVSIWNDYIKYSIQKWKNKIGKLSFLWIMLWYMLFMKPPTWPTSPFNPSPQIPLPYDQGIINSFKVRNVIDLIIL
jgi:hypothetical protein